MSATTEERTASGDGTTFDEDRAEAFEDRFADALNEAGLVLMTSIGHRTGLFDAMDGAEAATSEEVARAAGLEERYVREWLSALAVGGMVELSGGEAAGAGKPRFRLPPEHAAFLTRRATPQNLAVLAQYLAVLGSVEDELVECFREGGGVPYERYPRFHSVMAEDSAQTVLSSLEEHILPLLPGLPGRLERGARWLDAGCGSGLALLQMAAAYPESHFVGYDLSEEAIERARAEAARRGLDNVRFEVRDLSDFDETAEAGAFDYVSTFDAVHDQARPKALLRGIARSLRPDGAYLMQDIRASSHVEENTDHPLGPILYTVSTMHCMTVSLAQGGDGLGTMWGRQTALRYLEEAGFGNVEIHELEHDIQNDYYVARLG